MTERQSEVLARFKKGEKPKEIAAALGITESGVYQHKRNFIKMGLLPKKSKRQSGTKRQRDRRARRGLGNQGATLLRHDPTGGNGSSGYFEITSTSSDTIDPVAVIANRINVVSETIQARREAVASAVEMLEQATVDLDELGGEAKRLEKALTILAPSSNGSRKKTTRRRRKPTATPLQQVVPA